MTIQTPAVGRITSRLGTLEFTHDFANGLPTEATVERLYDELDFQRACQAYLWGLPIVAFAQWQWVHENVFGAASGDVVASVAYTDKLGILTANTTTPYYVSFFDLADTGPFVVEMPPGATSGLSDDAWQRPMMDMGLPGPDKGQGAKYVFVGPGQEAPASDDYSVVHSATFNMVFGFRALDPDPARGQATLDALRLYPLSGSEAPAATRFVEPGGKPYLAVQPRGLAYWERLADILAREPVEERDRLFHAMLKPLGIEKGSPFAPDERQQAILIDAALVGEAMAKVNTFDKRRVGEPFWPDRRWHNIIVLDPSQRAENYEQLDERASFFYEAITMSDAYIPRVPGVGQAYIGSYKDSAGGWLDGGNTYRLRVPPNPPAKIFWSVTVYDVDTRCIINNEQQIADRSSRMDLLRNDDESVDIYFGPNVQDGLDQNWIPTVADKDWFAYFRFYGPTEAYFDRSWALPDIELIR
jgi:hypothetical protein